MKAFHNAEVSAQDVEGCPGVSIQWVIGKNVQAPNFAMRIVSLEPGSATEHHGHGWEHEVYVIEGQGIVRDVQGRAEIGPGSCIYVEPDEIHNFANTGSSTMRFICVIPNPEG